MLPEGWQDLEIHDLCLAKLAAAREKDHRFVSSLLSAGLVELTTLAERVDHMTNADPRTRQAIHEWISANAPKPEPGTQRDAATNSGRPTVSTRSTREPWRTAHRMDPTNTGQKIQAAENSTSPLDTTDDGPRAARN